MGMDEVEVESCSRHSRLFCAKEPQPDAHTHTLHTHTLPTRAHPLFCMPRGRVCRASAAPAQSAGVAALSAALLLCSLFAPSTAYILPGTYPTSYKRGQVLYGA
jgi:hypothetical protein